jgi:hypothetical protein
MANLKLANAADEQIRKQFGEVFAKANKNDPKPADLKAVRAMMGAHPDLELWRHYVSPMRAAEGYVLSNAPMPEATMQVWCQRQASIRKELGYDDAPPLEKLLIEHVTLCHLRLAVVEIQHTQYTLAAPSCALTAGVYWDRRLSAAQRRLARAAVQLARVRKLTAEAERACRGAPAASARPLKALTG